MYLIDWIHLFSLSKFYTIFIFAPFFHCLTKLNLIDFISSLSPTQFHVDWIVSSHATGFELSLECIQLFFMTKHVP